MRQRRLFCPYAWAAVRRAPGGLVIDAWTLATTQRAARRKTAARDRLLPQTAEALPVLDVVCVSITIEGYLDRDRLNEMARGKESDGK